MEWVMETVLPREVRKLVLPTEEKDNQIQALEFTNEKHQQKILRLNKETDDRVANRYVARRSSPKLLYSVSVQAPGKT